jgi:hypothetical protein
MGTIGEVHLFRPCRPIRSKKKAARKALTALSRLRGVSGDTQFLPILLSYGGAVVQSIVELTLLLLRVAVGWKKRVLEELNC